MTHGVIGLATSKTPEVGSSSSISETCKQDQSSYQADTFGLTAASQVQSMVDMLVREHASIVQALQSEICCLRQQLANAESCASIVDKTKAGEPSFGDGKASVPKSESNEVSVTGADNPIVVGGEPTKASSFGSEVSQNSSSSQAHPVMSRRGTLLTHQGSMKEKPTEKKDAWKNVTMTKRQKAWLASFRGVRKFVLSDTFEMLTGSVIIVNTIFMALEQQYDGINIGHEIDPAVHTKTGTQVMPGAADAFVVADMVFNALFLLELLLRLYTFRLHSFRMPWMWFDTTIVVLGVIDSVTMGGGIGIDPTMARLVRLVRLARLLKIFKSMSTVDSLFLLIKAVVASVSALTWSFILLLVVQVSAALFINQMLKNDLEDDAGDREVRKELYKYFGTFSNSMVTMFEITLANWVPTCRFLIDNVSGHFFWFYLIYRCIFCFCVIKVISAVFIAETTKVQQNDTELTVMRSQREKHAFKGHLSHLFREIDEDADGIITQDEFQEFLNGDSALQLATVGLNKADFQRIFDLIQNDGCVSVELFVKSIQSLKGNASRIDVEHIFLSIREVINEMELTVEKKLAQSIASIGSLPQPVMPIPPKLECEAQVQDAKVIWNLAAPSNHTSEI